MVSHRSLRAGYSNESKQTEICRHENGLEHSHQSINWAKVFLSIRLYSEGKQKEGLELLETTKNNYLKALDGYELHPYLDTFYQQIGNVCIHLRLFERAATNYEKLIELKQLQYGKNSKHLSENLMQL